MKSVLGRRPNTGIRSTRLTTQNSHVIRVPELSATPPKRCNSNDAISKLEIRLGELRATFLRNHSSVPHSGVVLPNRCNACGALLPRLFLLSGGGIATIGVRHAGDTPSRGFYGRKTPRWALGGAVDCRCCAQRAVHLGRMRRKSGVWGEVVYVLSVGSRCWGRAVGPRQCGRLGWRRRS